MKDLKKAYPRVFAGLRGCGTRGVGRKTLELYFHTAQAKESLMATSLNTHGTHLVFIPDVASPTSVTLFNLLMEMPDTLVDEAMKKYGTVTNHFRHKRNFEGLTLLTGLRVYKIQQKGFIPNNITIQGHNVRTLYTGQKEELEKRKVERESKKAEAATQLKDEMAAFKARLHEFPLVTGGVRRSFVHPAREMPPNPGVEEAALARHDDIVKAEASGLFSIEDNSMEDMPDTEFYLEKEKCYMGRVGVDVPDFLAMVLSTNHHRLPVSRFAGEHTLPSLFALAYWAQFGYARDVATDKLDMNVFRRDAVKEWLTWHNYSKGAIRDFADGFAALFTGVQMVLPKKGSIEF